MLNLLQRIAAAFKAGPGAGTGTAPISPFGGLYSYQTGAYGFADFAPDGLAPAAADGPLYLNVVVAACLGWLDRNFPVADMQVVAVTREGDGPQVDDHPFIALMDRPNPLDDFHSFWQAFLLSDVVDGNTFFVKVRNARGIHSLWWVPPWDAVGIPAPDRNAEKPLLHYEIRINGEKVVYPVDDVIHIKDGRDPFNPLRGLAKLKAGLRSTSTIDRAELYTQTLMRNCGAIPTIISPAIAGEQIHPDNIPSMRAQHRANQTGGNNGMPVFSTGAVKVDRLGLSPEEMVLHTLREFPVAAICALIGTPAMAVGLPDPGKTYSNLAEALRSAWQNGLIPRQARAAEAIDRQCPELIDRSRERLKWDYSHVKALQDDWAAKVDGLVKAAGGAIMTKNEARGMLHLDPIKGEDELTKPPPPPVPGQLPKPGEPRALTPPNAETDPKKKSGTIEREDGGPPFGVKAGGKTPGGGKPTGKREDEDNTFGLPDGDPIKIKLQKLFAEQARKVLGTIPTIGATLPDVFPELTDWDAPFAAAMTPLIAAYWQEAGTKEAGAIAARTGLDPIAWKVTNPHLHTMIEEASFAFCRSTNDTTHLKLNDALDRLKGEFHQGLVVHGETIPELKKRVQSVFTEASDSRAETIARTETARAVHAAGMQADIESGVVAGYEWLLSAHACPLCHRIAADAKQVKLGQAFAVVGDHPDYSLVRHPPAHPSCRCSVLSILVDTYGGPADPVWAPTLIQPQKPGYVKPEPKPPAIPPRPLYGPSTATVQAIGLDGVVYGPIEPTVIESILKTVLGRPVAIEEVASLVGAPGDARVTVQAHGAGHADLFIQIDHPRYFASRVLKKTEAGPVLSNEMFYVKKPFQGQGIGSDVFARQVESAARLGVTRIKTDAAKSDTENGYYTWPRLGYDAPIPASVTLPPAFAGARNVSDLMKTPDGVKFWQTHGVELPGAVFDLSEGSLSRKRLDAYLQAKHEARHAQTPAAG